MLTVVCWKWRPTAGYRSTFTALHVNVLARMVRRHMPAIPYEIVCITDDARDIVECDRVLPLWPDHGALESPHGPRNPSCYRRLRMFARDAGDWLGERILSIDLDCVVTGDLTPIVSRTDPIVLWGDTNPTTHYNGGLILFTAGAHPELWEEFDPVESPRFASSRGQHGSDQAWISARLGPGKPMFTTADGIYSYRVHLRPQGAALPAGARVVMFHGQVDPWSEEAQRLDWVRAHWR